MIVGIDPGARGALALFDGARLAAVADMPTVSVRVGKTQRARVNAAELARILRDWAPDHAAVEHVAPRGGPVDRGGDTPMTAGYLMLAAGVVEGVLAALGIPVTPVDARVWRKAAGITLASGMSYQDRKEASRQRALQLFPVQAGYFARKMDSDRAEAALIGRWLLGRERGA